MLQFSLYLYKYVFCTSEVIDSFKITNISIKKLTTEVICVKTYLAINNLDVTNKNKNVRDNGNVQSLKIKQTKSNKN